MGIQTTRSVWRIDYMTQSGVGFSGSSAPSATVSGSDYRRELCDAATLFALFLGPSRSAGATPEGTLAILFNPLIRRSLSRPRQSQHLLRYLVHKQASVLAATARPGLFARLTATTGNWYDSEGARPCEVVLVCKQAPAIARKKITPSAMPE